MQVILLYVRHDQPLEETDDAALSTQGSWLVESSVNDCLPLSNFNQSDQR